MGKSTVLYGRFTPADREVPIVYIAASLGCDGDSISTTADVPSSNENLKIEGYSVATGAGPITDQPNPTNEWFDRLAPQPLAPIETAVGEAVKWAELLITKIPCRDALFATAVHDVQ